MARTGSGRQLPRTRALYLSGPAGRVGAACERLLNLGITSGDRVGIWSHNNTAWLLLQLATAKTGMILVNLNPAYRVSEVEFALNKADCKVLVTMLRYKSSDYLGMLRELAPELDTAKFGALRAARVPNLRHVVWIDTADHTQRAKRPSTMCLAWGDSPYCLPVVMRRTGVSRRSARRLKPPTRSIFSSPVARRVSRRAQPSRTATF